LDVWETFLGLLFRYPTLSAKSAERIGHGIFAEELAQERETIEGWKRARDEA